MIFIASANVHVVCFCLFVLGALFLCGIMLLMGYLLGGRSLLSHSKDVPFESGIDACGNARLRFSVKFYLIGMFFVIFDAEALYLYIWSIVIRESGWFGLIEVVVFMFILLLGLMYLINMNALKWR